MKKIFALALAIVIVLCLFAGCSNTEHANKTQDETQIEVDHDLDLVEVPGYDYLVYSAETGTVYYFIRTSYGRTGVGYMSPYIKNGHYCEYVDNEIVEVDTN